MPTMLIEPSTDRLVVDLGRIVSLDGRTIGALAALIARARATDVVVRCDPDLARQLQVAGYPPVVITR